ncbi:putative xaa-pro dipeptidase protein [Phaeoacremonium minimum UCRPA7]|uniref:Xaa-Pro aminopeptidase n=1 Tax=Phaeoacremonium minimum (strain UCR-PA7) TaxID=1286976 RepID=R8BFJ0_PHAM7|nr:putative xaa-pro dipeptidase protein [Phaeoacremonium minimum UCRPA7]EON98068.1 putative xaa-pro dipeptidase protein [Phaeoacremonium minimum UCRPA7]
MTCSIRLAKQHARKVVKELGFSTGLIYLPGEPTRAFEDSDVEVPFRQRRYFYYLSGANFPGCAVTYDIGNDLLTLWIPYVDPTQKLWHGSTPSIKDCLTSYEVDQVQYIANLEKYLYLTLGPTSIMYVLNANQGPPPRTRPGRGPLHIDTNKLRPAIDAARVVKSDYEVAMIRKANAVSSAAHKMILQRMKSITNEREIEAVFTGFCIANGAKQAYPVIAGSGPNAASLHYGANNEALEGRQLVVLDAGAEWDCYASDVTRTLPIGGKFASPEAEAVYAVVERMQTECVDRIKPGVVYYSLHLHAAMVAVVELLRLGILTGGTAREIFAAGTVAAFFPHGLGHHVGLEVHDVMGRERLLLGEKGVQGAGAGGPGRLGRRLGKREMFTPELLVRMARDAVTTPPPYKGRQKLEKNMIVTIEPGIYFCREYIESYFLKSPVHAKFIDKEILEQYYPVGGVRIEDCILVTDDGHENLTTAPKAKEAMAIMNGEGF